MADAVGHSEVAETPAEITFTAPKMYQMFLKGQEFEAAVRRVAGRTVRITLKVGEATPQRRHLLQRQSLPLQKMKQPSARWRIRK